MGCHARCKNCNSNLYIQEQKNELSFPIQITCFTCGQPKSYQNYELTQERHDYKCNFCQKSFHILKSPPLSVFCPHCDSNIYINSDGSLTLFSEGTMPSKETAAAGGLIGGAAIGSLFGPAGTIVGGLLGAALGYQGTSKEAKYQDGV